MGGKAGRPAYDLGPGLAERLGGDDAAFEVCLVERPKELIEFGLQGSAGAD